MIGNTASATSVSGGRHREHERERHDAHEERVRGLHDPGAEQHADGREVVHGAAHEVADAVLPVPRRGQAQQVVEEVLAHLVLDVARGADQDAAREEERDRVAHGEEDDERREAEEPLAGHARAELLDRPPHDAGHREKEPRRREDRARIRPVGAGTATEIAKEAGEVSHIGRSVARGNGAVPAPPSRNIQDVADAGASWTARREGPNREEGTYELSRSSSSPSSLSCCLAALVLIPILRVYRGTRLVACPETKRPAAVELDAIHAAFPLLGDEAGAVPPLELLALARKGGLRPGVPLARSSAIPAPASCATSWRAGITASPASSAGSRFPR